jgi:Antitoxin Phd_YefM, type II toxin-antitoxin system
MSILTYAFINVFLHVVVKPSQLRANLYRLLDRVLKTGEPIEIERAGKRLLLVPKEMKSKLDNLVKRDVIVGDPEDLVHLDWSKDWRGDLP